LRRPNPPKKTPEQGIKKLGQQLIDS
jgi:hypothetical protein